MRTAEGARHRTAGVPPDRAVGPKFRRPYGRAISGQGAAAGMDREASLAAIRVPEGEGCIAMSVKSLMFLTSALVSATLVLEPLTANAAGLRQSGTWGRPAAVSSPVSNLRCDGVPGLYVNIRNNSIHLLVKHVIFVLFYCGF